VQGNANLSYGEIRVLTTAVWKTSARLLLEKINPATKDALAIAEPIFFDFSRALVIYTASKYNQGNSGFVAACSRTC
jgi:hypothetical protein